MEAQVSDILARRAELTPERVAIVDAESGRRYRYRELWERARNLAGHLQQAGIKRGDRLAVLAPNGVFMTDVLFAASMVGAVFTPINYRLAPREVAYILQDAAPRLMVWSEAYRATVEALPQDLLPPMLHLEQEYPVWIAEPSEPRLDVMEPEEPLAIFYTSGTTGRPKGAIQPHRMILWNSVNTLLSWELGPADVAPIFTPQFHSGGINVLMVPLLHAGGTLVVTKGFDAARALEIIEQERATIVFLVPTMFQRLLEQPRFHETDFRSVRFWISGGAPLPVELHARYSKLGIPFHQGYGLTEVGVNCFTLTHAESFQKPGSVGKPILHSRMRLVDEEGREVPRGQVGELCIAGPHVFTGYLNQPEATAAVLRDGWFHTGDLARQDDDGFYYIVGRRKEMFISGGENVYPAEVEQVLLEHPDVTEAAVVGVPDETWGEVGRAFVVLRPESPLASRGSEAVAEALQAYCRERLAHYKVPKSYRTASALPRNAYGKLLKQELAEDR